LPCFHAVAQDEDNVSPFNLLKESGVKTASTSSPPELQSPADGEIIKVDSLTFSWTPAVPPEGDVVLLYGLDISVDQSYWMWPSINFPANLTATAWTLPKEDLSYLVNTDRMDLIYWRVYVFYLHAVFPDYSSTRSFGVLKMPAAWINSSYWNGWTETDDLTVWAAMGSYPLGGWSYPECTYWNPSYIAITTLPSVPLIWSNYFDDFQLTPVRFADQYQVQISTSSVFDSLTVDAATGNNSYITPVLFPGVYYWRVYARNGDLVTEWNHPRKFVIVSGPAPKPAEFVVNNLSITPGEVKIGEEATITANVTDVGDLEGTYTVILKINGVVVQTKNVTLQGGASTLVNFNAFETVAGTYLIEVDGQTGNLRVTQTAQPRVVGVQQGAWIKYNVSVEATGGAVPPEFADMSNVKLVITGVSGTSVTLDVIAQFKNGTTQTIAHYSLNVDSGSATEGGVNFLLIAANLRAGDPVYTSQPNIKINETISWQHSNYVRLANHLDLAENGNYYWDRATGVLLYGEIPILLENTMSTATLTAEITDTSVFTHTTPFSNPPSNPSPFSMDAIINILKQMILPIILAVVAAVVIIILIRRRRNRARQKQATPEKPGKAEPQGTPEKKGERKLKKRRPNLIPGLIVVGVGAALLVFTIATAYGLVCNDFSASSSLDPLLNLLGKIVKVCVHLIYLGLMLVVSAIIISRGMSLTKPKQEVSKRRFGLKKVLVVATIIIIVIACLVFLLPALLRLLGAGSPGSFGTTPQGPSFGQPSFGQGKFSLGIGAVQWGENMVNVSLRNFGTNAATITSVRVNNVDQTASSNLPLTINPGETKVLQISFNYDQGISYNLILQFVDGTTANFTLPPAT